MDNDEAQETSKSTSSSILWPETMMRTKPEVETDAAREDDDSTIIEQSAGHGTTGGADDGGHLCRVPSDVAFSVDALVRVETSQPMWLCDDTANASHRRRQLDCYVNDEHDRHVDVVADFLVSRALLESAQHEEHTFDDATVSCVQLLFAEENPCSGDEVHAACRFLLDTDLFQDQLENKSIAADATETPEWEPPFGQMVLWWELRAHIQRCMISQRQQRQNRSNRLLRASDVVANGLSTSAQVIETGLRGSVPYVHTGLDHIGSAVKRILTPVQTSTSVFTSPRNEVVTLAYSNAASRTTSGLHHGAKTTVAVIRDASTHTVEWIADKFQREEIGERLLPDTNHRHAVQAAAKVGLATVGAVAIIGEAVWDVTGQVAHKASYVTADVIRYKYGDGAGTLAEHVSDTTGNVVRTAAQVAMLERSVMAKVVAKNSGKVQIRRRGSAKHEAGYEHEREEEDFTEWDEEEQGVDKKLSPASDKTV